MVSISSLVSSIRLAVVRSLLSDGTMESDLARQRLQNDGGAVALFDWRSTVFLHFAVVPEALQPCVPFPLDLHGGMAYVSVVTFDQRDFRLPRGGPLAHVIHPLGSNLFCNLRTYVRVRGEPGVFFMTEWIPNPLTVVTAPIYPGLRCRLARLQFTRDGSRVHRTVIAQEGRMTVEAEVPDSVPLSPPPAGSVADFCLERYTALTQSPFGPMRFHIWHPPWSQADTQAWLSDDRLLATRPWFSAAAPAGAQYSPGITGVQIGLPRPLRD